MSAEGDDLLAFEKALKSLTQIDPQVLLPRVSEYVEFKKTKSGRLLPLRSKSEIYMRHVDIALLCLLDLNPLIPGLTSEWENENWKIFDDVFPLTDVFPLIDGPEGRTLIQCPPEYRDMIEADVDGVTFYRLVERVSVLEREGKSHGAYVGGYDKCLCPPEAKKIGPPDAKEGGVVPDRIDIVFGTAEHAGQTYLYTGSSRFSDAFLIRSLRHRLQDSLHVLEFGSVQNGEVIIEPHPSVGLYSLPPTNRKAMVLIRDYAKKVPFMKSAMADHVVVDFTGVGFLYDVANRIVLSDEEWDLVSRDDNFTELRSNGVPLSRGSVWKVLDITDYSLPLRATSVYFKYKDATDPEDVHDRVALFQIFANGEVVFCGTEDERADFGGRDPPRARARGPRRIERPLGISERRIN